MGRRQDLALPDDDGTHGHLACPKGFSRLGEGQLHELFIPVHIHCSLKYKACSVPHSGLAANLLYFERVIINVKFPATGRGLPGKG
jgi:hypothetical protein